MDIDRDSTEFIYAAVSGDLPVTAEVAFVEPLPSRPVGGDWKTATVVDDQHTLWADAVATGLSGAFYLARRVGAFDDNDVVLAPGTYQMWARLTYTSEQMVRILGTVTVT